MAYNMEVAGGSWAAMDVPFPQQEAAAGELAADWQEPAEAAVAGVPTLPRRLAKSAFVGLVLAIMLLAIITASLLFGWLMVWLPGELIQLHIAGRLTWSAFSGDFTTAFYQARALVHLA